MMTSDDKEFVVVGYNGKIKFLTLKEDENGFNIVAEFDIFDLFKINDSFKLIKDNTFYIQSLKIGAKCCIIGISNGDILKIDCSKLEEELDK